MVDYGIYFDPDIPGDKLTNVFLVADIMFKRIKQIKIIRGSI